MAELSHSERRGRDGRRRSSKGWMAAHRDGTAHCGPAFAPLHWSPLWPSTRPHDRDRSTQAPAAR
eukprot:2566869-Prymnesium_polylepis.2